MAAYTADAAREVIARVLVDQAAGAGDYIVYAKVQRGGSGSSYVMLPKTTGTAASGETAIGFVSISLPVSTGDVVTIWVDGLAGDTTTPDIITDWYEVDTLRPTTADRTLDVSAGGEAGIDWANVGTPGSTVSLSATTVATVTTAATASALTTAQADLTTLTGRLSAARAGYLDNLSAGAVATASALSSVATNVTTLVTGVTVSSIGTGVITAASIAAGAGAKIADIVLRRTTANVEASSDGDTLGGRSLYGAVARLAHKVSTSAGTMTVTKSDDTTALTTAVLTTDASADPVTVIDPAA